MLQAHKTSFYEVILSLRGYLSRHIGKNGSVRKSFPRECSLGRTISDGRGREREEKIVVLVCAHCLSSLLN